MNIIFFKFLFANPEKINFQKKQNLSPNPTLQAYCMEEFFAEEMFENQGTLTQEEIREMSDAPTLIMMFLMFVFMLVGMALSDPFKKD